MLNRTVFFSELRDSLFKKALPQRAVDGMNFILDTLEDYKNLAQSQAVWIDWQAYIFATVYHETAQKMQPIAEYGKGKGREYGRAVPPYNQVYYGRGHVQLTWKENYERAGKTIGVDLVKYPDLALDPHNSAKIMFLGMHQAWFSKGNSLVKHINADKCDFINARRIINGTDKAALIASYAEEFKEAFQAAYSAKASTSDDVKKAKPTGKSAVQSTTNAAGATTIAGGGVILVSEGAKAVKDIIQPIQDARDAVSTATSGLPSYLIIGVCVALIVAGTWTMWERRKKRLEYGI